MRRKGKHNKESATREGEAVATIVEYSAQKQAVNGYPAKIVSPPSPSGCCASSMEQVGTIRDENGWPFVYHRCGVCGYTVRRLATRNELLETMRTWRRVGEEASKRGVA
jgi:hypothetical protein